MDMYRRVIEDPLEFPPSFDQDTCSLLSGVRLNFIYKKRRGGKKKLNR